jgi:hypothetical protein
MQGTGVLAKNKSLCKLCCADVGESMTITFTLTGFHDPVNYLLEVTRQKTTTAWLQVEGKGLWSSISLRR